VELTVSCSDSRLNNAAWATSGGDLLVSGGSKTASSTWDSSLLTKAPRTAIGIKADGTVVSYVVDGRKSSHSNGLSLNDLADELLRQGCQYVLNFDGGGSSSLNFRYPNTTDVALQNIPSDGALRGCSTFVVFISGNESYADTYGNWASKYIEALTDDGILYGSTSGNNTYYYPNSSLTRAEFAAILTRYLDIDTSQYSSAAGVFADYSGISDWAKPYADAMAALGYIEGRATSAGNMFDGNGNITRAEVCTILGRIIGGTANTSVLDKFSDSASIPAWAKKYMAIVVDAGIISGYNDGTIRANANMLRSEIAKVVYYLEA